MISDKNLYPEQIAERLTYCNNSPVVGALVEHWPGNLRVLGSMPSTPNSVVVVSLSKELYSNCSAVPQ